MQAFEYKTVNISKRVDGDIVLDLTELNALGKQGWHLVPILTLNFTILMERELSAQKV